MRCILEKCTKEGVPIEKTKEAPIHHGLDSKLVERFMEEITEGKA
jgi:hypothetical protein